MNIVFLDTITLGEVSNLNNFSKLGNFVPYHTTTPEQVIERVKNAHVIITNKVQITAEIMDACNNLKLICIAATGMNNVDLQHASENDIDVKNVAGYSTESVAQFTFNMLFYLLHQTEYYNKYVQLGEYQQSSLFTHHKFSFFELKDKIFGIVGLGNIGRRVAQLATAFGARVLYYSTSGKNNTTDYRQVSLTELMSNADCITVHCPLNEQTQNLIGKQQLALMKPSAYILNLGRGGIINETDLAQAIDNNKIAGAATDVYTNEPITADNPLLHVRNKNRLLLTPHIAWASVEARELLLNKIYDNINSATIH